MVCFRYVIVNTVHKGENKDNNNNKDKNKKKKKKKKKKKNRVQFTLSINTGHKYTVLRIASRWQHSN